MQEPASADSSSKDALRGALLEYSRSPGKYQVAFRQPPLLFSAIRDVLQLAVGREGENGRTSTEARSLRDAARFFVRTALLFPGADHYALLGVERSADSTELKDRYRLMMRLLHPDFAGPDAGAWPADSAVRINRAYDTLSSAVQRRLYDETLSPGPAVKAGLAPDLRRPRALSAHSDGDARQSRFKILAAVCAVAGGALVLLIVSATGSPESVHLVQRNGVPAEARKVVALQEPALPEASPVARLQEALAQFRPSLTVSPPKLAETSAPRTATPVAPKRADMSRASTSDLVLRPPPVLAPSRDIGPSVQAAAPPTPEAKQELLLASSPALAPPVVQPAPVVAPAMAPLPPVQVATAPRPPLRPGPTLIEAQPLLSQLLQVMESGRGDRILNLLDAEARSKPSAQALSRQYDSIVDGARPVRVSHVEFKAEPGDGRLLVVGYVRVLAGEQTIGTLGKRMVLRAEFASREGTVVITGLSGGPVN